MESLVPEYSMLGHVRERTGGALPGIAPSNTYPTGDGGFVVIAGNSDPIYVRLMQAIGRPDLAERPDLAQNDGRARHCELIDEAIAAWTGSRGIDEVLEILEGARSRPAASIRPPTSSPIPITRRGRCCWTPRCPTARP